MSATAASAWLTTVPRSPRGSTSDSRTSKPKAAPAWCVRALYWAPSKADLWWPPTSGCPAREGLFRSGPLPAVKWPVVDNAATASSSYGRSEFETQRQRMSLTILRRICPSYDSPDFGNQDLASKSCLKILPVDTDVVS